MVFIINKADGADDWMDDEISKFKEIFKQAGSDAKETMEFIIATSGTPSTGRSGRVDTGAMIEGVNSRIEEETDYSVRVSFGWDMEDFERPYPIYQDQGFTHVPDGAFIPGMHALQDARSEAEVQIKNEIRRME